ncbi:unnamed protein product, partial [Ceratitis capitata]
MEHHNLVISTTANNLISIFTGVSLCKQLPPLSFQHVLRVIIVLAGVAQALSVNSKDVREYSIIRSMANDR